jgi:putative ABC transport system substrate-binding protein
MDEAPPPKIADAQSRALEAAAMPFERPARYELIVNLKAAKVIGLTIPDSFVLLADEVIE